jgi:hypothetical protein
MFLAGNLARSGKHSGTIKIYGARYLLMSPDHFLGTWRVLASLAPDQKHLADENIRNLILFIDVYTRF